MGLYIFLYIWSILTCFLLKTKIKYKEIIYLIINLIPLIFFSAVRSDNVGTDLPMYLSFYNTMSEDILCIIENRMEFFYAILNYLVYMLTDSSVMLLFVIACITYISIFYCFYRCSANIAASIIIFIGFYIYCTSLNAVRQYLAIGFLCLAFYYVHHKLSTKISLVLSIVAIFFHRSAVIMLPFIVLYPVLNSWRRYIICFSVTAVCFTVGVGCYEVIYSLLPQYSVYSGLHFIKSREFTASIILPVITLVFVLISTIYLYHTRKNFDSELSYYNILMLLYSLSWLASFKVYIFYRMVYYYEIFICLVIPYVVEKFFKPKIAVYIFVFLIMFVYLFLHLSKNTSLVVPYGFSF